MLQCINSLSSNPIDGGKKLSAQNLILTLGYIFWFCENEISLPDLHIINQWYYVISGVSIWLKMSSCVKIKGTIYKLWNHFVFFIVSWCKLSFFSFCKRTVFHLMYIFFEPLCYKIWLSSSILNMFYLIR